MPDNQKENINSMQHVFCGLHVLYVIWMFIVKKTILEWEKVVEEGGSHEGFKNTNSRNCRTYNILFEISTLLPYNHGDEKHGQADQWWAYITNKTQNRILFFTS